MNAAQLSQLIEKIVEKRVAEELTKRLPMMVESVLTKRYLKDLVSEQVQGSRKSSRLSEVMGEEDEDVPGPMTNTDRGIYHSVPVVKEQTVRKPSTKVAIAKLAGGDKEFAAFFEGTTPTGHPEAPVSPVDQELVPESTLNQMFDMKHIQRLAKATVPAAKQQRQMIDPELALKQQRQRLDERVVGYKPHDPTPVVVPRNRIEEVFSASSEDPFEARMREIESRRAQLGL